MILDIATLLGGFTSLWFIYDKRIVIFNRINIRSRKSINPLSLPDGEFVFIFDKSDLLINGLYLPVDEQENKICLTLTNHGILQNKSGAFKLTGPGRKMLI